jgi:hypothetical protein
MSWNEHVVTTCPFLGNGFMPMPQSQARRLPAEANTLLGGKLRGQSDIYKRLQLCQTLTDESCYLVPVH